MNVKYTGQQYKRFCSSRRIMLVVSLVATTALSGCSQVPDAVNPVEWYNSSVEFLAGEETAETGNKQEQAVSQNESKADKTSQFPQISRVEQQRQIRENISGGLVADIEGRQRAAAVARQGRAVKPLITETEVAATQPAPPAMPVTPVQMVNSVPAAVSAAQQMPKQIQAAAPLMPKTVSAAQMTSVAEPVLKFDSTARTYEEKNFEQRMARRLAEIKARANQPGPFDTTASAFSANYLNMPTVIVSSNGIETAAYEATPGVNQAAMSPAQNVSSQFIKNADALPIPGRSIKIATILFKNGSSKISAGDRRILKKVLAMARQRGGQLRIVGHASSRTRNLDPIRHKMTNFEISVKRADNVAHELVRLGLNKNNLLIGAVSDMNPQYLEYMPSGEAGNRRTEIYLDT